MPFPICKKVRVIEFYRGIIDVLLARWTSLRTDHDVLSFIEVRTRGSERFGNPKESINKKETTPDL